MSPTTSLPKTTDALTRRNKIPMRLANWAFKLMDERGQKAMAEVIRQGGQVVNDAWRAERERQMDEMIVSGRLNLRAYSATTPAPVSGADPQKENR